MKPSPPRKHHPVHRGPPWEILFVGYGDWHLWKRDGFRTRSAQLCKFLSRSERISRIHVLNETVYLRGVHSGFNIPRMQRFFTLPLRAGIRKEEEKIVLLDPSRFLVGPERLKRPFTVRGIRHALQALECQAPILWIANVHKAYLMDEIPAALKIFDAIDDWESVDDYQRLKPRIRAGYETVLERADTIFTVSRHLRDRLSSRSRTPHVVHLPNGVDTELFSEPAPPPSVRKQKGRDRAPLLTYVGVISERTHMELIEETARLRPDCRVRLVGPATRDTARKWEKLRLLPNLEWKGRVPHSEIPSLLRASDVLLLPHRRSRLSLSMDPLKLYEYLTTGLPVVATPVPPCEDFSHLINVAEEQQFVSKVGEALEEAGRPESEALWKARIQEAKRHAWETRVETILGHIEERTDPHVSRGIPPFRS